MHPILAKQSYLWTYLGAWLAAGGLLAVLFVLSGEMSWLGAVTLALPLALLYAFICLASYYPCLAAPASAEGAPRLVVTHATSALLSSSLWVSFGLGWASLLERNPIFAGTLERLRGQVTLMVVVGILLYALIAAIHYLLIAFRTSREAELAAIEARREQQLAQRELDLARSIQARLLPPAELEGDGFRLAARHRAARYVAGDFYDIFRLEQGQLGLVVADVAGKGFGASLIMASVKAMLPLVASEHTVTETLGRLNRKLKGELGPREFVALLFARFDPASGFLELANSGLPDPYLLRGSDPPRPLEVPGPRLPLGLRESLEYQSLELRLEPQDRLLMLTDGLPEARSSSGEPLGYEALESLLEVPGEQPPGGWLDGLLQRVRSATGEESQDDLTALLLERSVNLLRRADRVATSTPG